MRAILIDPKNHKIEEVQCSEQGNDARIAAILEHIQAPSGLIDVVYIEHNSVMFVDDEGLLYDTQPHGYFQWGDNPEHQIAGRALIMGAGEGGETVDTKMPLDFAREKVQWPVLFTMRDLISILEGKQ